MKKNIFKVSVFTVFFLSVFAQSCADGKLFSFFVNDSTEITVENVASVDLPFDVPTPDITTNSTEEFENNDTKVELVKEIVIKNLSLTITSPDDQTFSFLKSINIYISTDDTDEIPLAWKENIDNNTQFLDLDVSPALLDKYVKGSSYKLRTEVVTKETLFRDVTIKIDMTFRVTADLL